jgi:addiction module RelE/StbE family toxin
MRAAADLEEIFEYVEKDSPENAARLIRRLLTAIDSLQFMPNRNKPIKGAAALGEQIRSMPVRPYLIRYHVKDSTRVVTILSVRHGARRQEP